MLHQGGFERVCVETARLMREDFQVTLLIFTDKDAHYDVSGIDVVNIDVPAVDGKLRKAINLFRRTRKIRRIKRERQIDVTYSFGSTANLANVLSRANDVVITSMRSSLDFDAPDRLKRILDGSDLMISCAKRMQEMLAERYHFTKTALLYNPLDIEAITEQAAVPVKETQGAEGITAQAGEMNAAEGKDTATAKLSGAPLIAAMGREDDAKGYWHLLKSFSILSQTLPDARLMIIGAGGFVREKALAQALGIARRVTFTGVQKNPFPYLARANLFVLPSNHEGFPNALVEAMALAKPVIACDCVSGPREILLADDEYADIGRRFPAGESVRDIIEGAYGMLTPDMDATPDYDEKRLTPDDYMFANAMKRMLTDEENMRRYQKSALQRAKDFSTADYRERLRQIIENTLSKKES